MMGLIITRHVYDRWPERMPDLPQSKKKIRKYVEFWLRRRTWIKTDKDNVYRVLISKNRQLIVKLEDFSTVVLSVTPRIEDYSEKVRLHG